MQTPRLDYLRIILIYAIAGVSIGFRASLRAPFVSMGTFIGQRYRSQFRYIPLFIALIVGSIIRPANPLYPPYSIEGLLCNFIAIGCCESINANINPENSKSLSFQVNMTGSFLVSIITFIASFFRGKTQSIGGLLLYILFEIFLGELLFIMYGFILTIKSGCVKDREWYQMVDEVEKKYKGQDPPKKKSTTPQIVHSPTSPLNVEVTAPKTMS